MNILFCTIKLLNTMTQKKILPALVFCWLFSLYSIQAQEWIVQNPYPVLKDILDIEMSENGRGWAIAKNRIIFRTFDFGAHWGIRAFPDNVGGTYLYGNINKVLIIPGTEGKSVFIASDDNKIFRTSDDGENWQLVFSLEAFDGHFETLSFLDEDGTTIGAMNKNIYVSHDQGTTWDTILLPDDSFVKKGFFLDEQNWWAADFKTNSAVLYKTTDGGQSWTQATSQTFSFVRKIHFFNAQEGLLADNSGLHRTNDGGATWNLISTAPAYLSDLHVLNENTLLCTMLTSVLYSTDGGQNWEESIIFPNIGGLKACTGLPDGRFWAAGAHSSIFFSDDGQNWISQTSNIPFNFNDICFADQNTGFALNAFNYVLRTTNGGAIWEDITDKLPVFSEWRIGYTDTTGKTIFLDKLGRIALSEDFGNSWQITDSINAATYNKTIQQMPDGSLYLFSTGGQLWRSTDGGYNWDFLGLTGILLTKDIYFNTPTSGWACGTNGQFAHTTDGGQTWQTVDLNTSKQLENLEFVNEQKGFLFPAAMNNDTFWITQDGGQNWTPTVLPLNMTYVYDLAFSDENHGWLAGGSPGAGSMAATTDGGQTWTMTGPSLPNSLQNLACPVPGELAWAAGLGGLIVKWANCDQSTNPPILSQITSDTDLLCSGEIVNLTASSLNADIFQWTLPSDWTIWGFENSASIDVIVGSESGIVSVTGKNACNEEDSVNSDLFTPVLPPEAPTLILSTTQPITLEAQGQADSYLWFLNGTEIAGETGPTLMPAENGIYTVIAVSNGCYSDLSNAVEVLSVSTQSLSANAKALHISPNPATDNFVLSNLPKGQKASLQLFDLYGRLMFSKELVTTDSSVAIGKPAIPPGLYYLRLEVGKQTYLGKIIFH